MKAKWLGKDKLHVLGPQRAAAGGGRPRSVAWAEARDIVLDAYARLLAAKWPTSPSAFFDKRWIDAPARPGKAPGAFAHPTVPSAHPYVLLNYWASRAT